MADQQKSLDRDRDELDNSSAYVESYHPLYSSPDADLALCSSDGIKFLVHKVIMSMTSEIFKNMVSGATDTGEPLQLEERSEILETTLNMIYPMGFSLDLSKKTFDFIWDLLIAAEKYEVKKMLEEFHVRIVADSYFQTRPLESFAIAVRCGWDNEIRMASYRALNFINKEGSWDVLHRIDVKMASELFNLPSRRRKFIMDNAGLVNTSILKYLVERELFVQPSGDTLALEGDFWKRAEVIKHSNLNQRFQIQNTLTYKAIPSCVLQPPVQAPRKKFRLNPMD